MTDYIGQQIEGYHLKSLLGEGHLAAVYHAIAPETQQQVAIKIIHPPFAQNASFQLNFLQTVQHVQSLVHPAIPKIHHYGQQPDLLYLITDFISGPSLRTVLSKATKQQIALPEALTVISQIAEAVDYAHQQGIIHANIKPENILLTTNPNPQGAPKIQAFLTDFELAQLSGAGAQTATDHSGGMLPYMSPEQCLEQPIDGRSDIYALGIILYQLVTGQLPFQINSLMEAVQIHPYRTPPPPRSIRPNLPEIVEKVILKAIAKQPKQRFQRAGELATMLRKITAVFSQKSPKLSASTSLPLNKEAELAETRLAPPVTPPSLFEAEPAAKSSPKGHSQLQDNLRDSDSIQEMSEKANRDSINETEVLADFEGNHLPDFEIEPTIMAEEKGEDIGERTILAQGLLTPQVDVALPQEMQVDSALTAPENGERIIISQHGLTANTFHLLKSQVSIGRLRNNDIILTAPDVSRQHARLERRESGWHIIDMGSAGGTFIANAQIPAQTAQIWPANTPLSIGPFVLHWLPNGEMPAAGDESWQTVRPGLLGLVERRLSSQPRTEAYQMGSRMAPRPSAPNFPPGTLNASSQSGQISVIFNPASLELAPGGQQEMQLTVQNLQPIRTAVQLSLSGLPTNWFSYRRDMVQLEPNEKATLAFTIHPPKEPGAAAGPHPYQITVQSMNNMAETAVLQAELVLQTYHQFQVDLTPESVTTSGEFQVNIHNQGNAPAKFSLTATDSGGILRFTGERGRIVIPAGKSETIEMTLAAKERPFLGKPQAQSFTVQVRAEDGKIVSKKGEVAITSLLPTWAFTAVIGLASLLLIAAIVIGFREFVFNGGEGTAVPTLSNAIADVGEETRLAQAFETAQAATSIAATAQIAGDMDNDGLSDEDEIDLGTLPDNPDTDADGLLDGQEVNQYKTNPKLQDTDGDTLTDGEEVNIHGTNPLLLDSDGDGKSDAQEIAEGTDPNATPTPVPLTSTVSPTTDIPKTIVTLSPEPTVNQTSAPGNRPPQANNDEGEIGEDFELTRTAPGILLNDTDIDGDNLIIVAVNGDSTNVGKQITLPSGALLTVNSNGSYIFNPIGQYDSLPENQTTQETFSYTISDGEGGNSTATVIITITGINDPPTDISLNNDSVAENQEPGTTIGAFIVTDIDNSIHDFFLPSDVEDNNLFEIDGNMLQSRTIFDFEATKTYSIRVHVTDGDIPFDKQLIINITNEPDAPQISDATFPIPENSLAGTYVGNVQLEDDDENDTHEFKIISGSSETFDIDNTGKITVLNNSLLDFEVQKIHTLKVQVKDSGNLTDEAIVTINVTDQNDPPKIENNEALNVITGTTSVITQSHLLSTDQDISNVTLTYKLTTIPTMGSLYKEDTLLNKDDEFTQDDINNGLIIYNHNGLSTGNDDFIFSVRDDRGESLTNYKFVFTITEKDP